MMSFHKKPAAFVDHVHLLVINFRKSLTFYREVLGFQLLAQSEQKAVLTADGTTPLLTIEQPDTVVPRQPRTTGLYHFALLLPRRSELAKALRHLIQIGYPLQGASDHLVSEAVYLADPDGNGIEIYADRPSSDWAWEHGQVAMDTKPIDAEHLLAETSGEIWNGLPAETVMGHIHLQVSNLKEAEQFYCKGLGFNLVNKYGRQALFISTNGYHHHIGLNTWNSEGSPAPAKNSAGLKHFSLILPSEDERQQIIEQLKHMDAFLIEEDGKTMTRDPSGNEIQLLVSR
jgi:catechol 2,3-dioxygenase